MTESKVLTVTLVCGEREWRMDWRANLPVRKACEHAGRVAGLVPGLACLRWIEFGEVAELLEPGTLGDVGVEDGDVLEVHYRRGVS